MTDARVQNEPFSFAASSCHSLLTTGTRSVRDGGSPFHSLGFSKSELSLLSPQIKSENLMRAVLTSFLTLALASCASITPQHFVGPNGKVAYSMSCSGMGRTLDACYKKAGEVCPSGYSIVDRASGTVGIQMSGGGTLITPQHSLAIECK